MGRGVQQFSMTLKSYTSCLTIFCLISFKKQKKVKYSIKKETDEE